MDTRQLQVLWELLGGQLDEFHDELLSKLAQGGYHDQLAYLGITVYEVPKVGSIPIQEYTITRGEVGVHFPSIESLKEVDTDDTDDAAITVALAASASFREQLDAELLKAIPDLILVPGVRFLLSEPGGGGETRCGGISCEYRAEKLAFWLRRYFWRDGVCCWFWIRPCQP